MANIYSILLVVLASFIGAAGSFYLKIGAKEFKIAAILKNYKLMLGLFLYGFSTIFYIIALKFEELTIVYPITSLTYIWVLMISAKYLKENMNSYKIYGIIFIIFGVFFIVR
ncbi:MAG: EamA family transporter [Nanoarchaeota archaeon]|nr:EamA family transporter [Nanoarchaeota archaeon]